MTNPFALTTLKQKTIAAAVLAITGTVTIGSGGTAVASTMNHEAGTMHASQSQMTHPQSTQAATDLRVGLNNLLGEHVTSSLHVTRSIAGGAPQHKIDAAMATQYANSDALSAAVGSVYGAEAQAQFSEMFREHIDESNKYAMEVAAGNQAGKDAALMELQEYLNELSSFFSTAIPGLPAQDVYALLNEHEDLINKSTEAYKAGDFVQSYQLEHQALVQVGTIADALAKGIIATQPAKFQ
jgi:hypothetical protein